MPDRAALYDRFVTTLGVLILVTAIGFVARSVWASKLDTDRFLTDSAARASDHQLLVDIHHRVNQMWCAELKQPVPAGGGC